MTADVKKLLVVGSNPRNQELLSEFIERLGYGVIRADTLGAVDQVLDDRRNVRFALVDITGFDPSVWERCARLHSLDIPLLVISPKQSNAVRKMGFSHGARTVLEKPLVMRELADTIHGFMQANE
jgi:DNA-binding response OmpR family regulator